MCVGECVGVYREGGGVCGVRDVCVGREVCVGE